LLLPMLQSMKGSLHPAMPASLSLKEKEGLFLPPHQVCLMTHSAT